MRTRYLLYDTLSGKFIKPGLWCNGEVQHGFGIVVIDNRGMVEVNWDSFLTVIYPNQCIFVPMLKKGKIDFIHSLPVEDIIELECNLGYEVRREVVCSTACVIGSTVHWNIIVENINNAMCEVSVTAVLYDNACVLLEMSSGSRLRQGLHTMHIGVHPVIMKYDNGMALEMILGSNDLVSSVNTEVELRDVNNVKYA